jgi:hypothetical protein
MASIVIPSRLRIMNYHHHFLQLVETQFAFTRSAILSIETSACSIRVSARLLYPSRYKSLISNIARCRRVFLLLKMVLSFMQPDLHEGSVGLAVTNVRTVEVGTTADSEIAAFRFPTPIAPIAEFTAA